MVRTWRSLTRQCPSIFKTFSSPNKPLLIWWNTLGLSDFKFDTIDGIGIFPIVQADCLPCQGLDVNYLKQERSQCWFTMDSNGLALLDADPIKATRLSMPVCNGSFCVIMRLLYGRITFSVTSKYKESCFVHSGVINHR